MDKIKRKWTKQKWFKVDSEDKDNPQLVTLHLIDKRIHYRINNQFKPLKSSETERLKNEYFLKSFIHRSQAGYLIFSKDFFLRKSEMEGDKKNNSEDWGLEVMKQINAVVKLIFFKAETKQTKDTNQEQLESSPKKAIPKKNILSLSPDVVCIQRNILEIKGISWQIPSTADHIIKKLAMAIDKVDSEEWNRIKELCQENEEKNIVRSYMLDALSKIFCSKQKRSSKKSFSTLIHPNIVKLMEELRKWIESEEFFSYIKQINLTNVYSYENTETNFLQASKTIRSSLYLPVKNNESQQGKQTDKETMEVDSACSINNAYHIERALNCYNLGKLSKDIALWIKEKQDIPAIQMIKNYYIQTVKNTYASENTSLSFSWQSKKALRLIHQYFKNRALCYDRKYGNRRDNRGCFLDYEKLNQQNQDQNSGTSDIFTLVYTQRITQYLFQHFNYHQYHDKKQKYYATNSEIITPSILKQCIKAKETIYKKLAQNIVNVQFTLSCMTKEQDKIRIPKINGKKLESAADIIENDLLSADFSDKKNEENEENKEKLEILVRALQNKFDPAYVKADFIYIHRLRTITHHRQFFVHNVLDYHKEKLRYNVEDRIKKLEEYYKAYIQEVLEQNNIMKYYSMDKLDRVIIDFNQNFNPNRTKKDLFLIQKSLPRFHKVYMRGMHLLGIDDINLQNIQENQQAHKYLWQFFYENLFPHFIEKKFCEEYEIFIKSFEGQEENRDFNLESFLVKNGFPVSVNLQRVENIDYFEKKETSQGFLSEKMSYVFYCQSLKEGSDQKSIQAINKRIVDITAILFLKFLTFVSDLDCYTIPTIVNSEEVISKDCFKGMIENWEIMPQIDYKIWQDKESKTLPYDSIRDPYQGLISLANFISLGQLSSLIHDLTKYKQFMDSLIYSYGINAIQIDPKFALFETSQSESNDFDLQQKYLTAVLPVLELFLIAKNKEFSQEKESDKGKEDSQEQEKGKKFLEKIQEYYPKELSRNLIGYTYTNIEVVDKYQAILPTSTMKPKDIDKQLIRFTFIRQLERYGESEQIKKIHCDYMTNNYSKEQFNQILKEYGAYKSFETGKTKIENKVQQYNETLKNFKNSITTEKEEEKLVAKDKEILWNEICCLNKAIQKYHYLDNILYLTAYRLAIQLQEDLYSRLIAWMYTFELKLYYYVQNCSEDSALKKANKDENQSIVKAIEKSIVKPMQSKEGASDEIEKEWKALACFLFGKASKKSAENLFSDQKQVFRLMAKTRNVIMHYKNLRELKRTTESIFFFNIYELYGAVYHLFGYYDIHLKRDVKQVFIKICQKHRMEIKNPEDLFVLEEKGNLLEDLNNTNKEITFKKNPFKSVKFIPAQKNFAPKNKTLRKQTTVQEEEKYVLNIIDPALVQYLAAFVLPDFEKLKKQENQGGKNDVPSQTI